MGQDIMLFAVWTIWIISFVCVCLWIKTATYTIIITIQSYAGAVVDGSKQTPYETLPRGSSLWLSKILLKRVNVRVLSWSDNTGQELSDVQIRIGCMIKHYTILWEDDSKEDVTKYVAAIEEWLTLWKSAGGRVKKQISREHSW